MPELDLDVPVAQLALALVDIPSVSGDEAAVADAVEAALRRYRHLTVARNGNAVVATLDSGAAERVILAGHLDTVPIKNNVPGAISEDGSELIGRGSVDMKAGVAVMLSLAATLTSATRNVTYVFYDLEEVEATRNGLGRIARDNPEWLASDFAVLLEPTSAVIEGGCNGTLRAEVTVPGVAAHSARSWKGVNAIHAAAPLLGALAEYKADTIEVDGLAYREGMNAVGIRGGIAGNVVPDECIVTINYRFAPSWDVDKAQRRLEDVVDGAGVDGATIAWTDVAEGARPGLDAPLAKEFANAVTSQGGEPARAKLGWTDVARFGALGIPAVNYGPGNPERAHSDDERCPVAEIDTCRAALAAWLLGEDA